METGLLAGRVPFIRGGSGDREAYVFFGVNAIFRRLDRTSNPQRYARQVAALLPGYRFTILGYASTGYDDILRDMAATLEQPSDLLMGISFGGFVAMRFAAEYPERARRLVLLVSGHRFSTQGWSMVERQMQFLEQGDLKHLVSENGLLFRRPWYSWLLRLALLGRGGRVLRGFRDTSAILRDYRALFGSAFADNAAYCRRIVCPSLVIGGTADPFFDREAIEETARLIPGAEVRIFERETHMLPIERSRDVARVVTEFAAPDILV